MLFISVSTSLLVATLLTALRIAPVFLFASVFSAFKVPPQARMFLVIGMAFMLVLGIGLSTVNEAAYATLPALLIAAIGELLVGSAIALGVIAAFAAFSFAGRLLDMQIGLGIATLFDPVTRVATPLIGTALTLMAMVMFYAIDAHHLLIRGFAYSFERVPLGGGIAGIDLPFLVLHAGLLFSYGLALIAPVMFVLLLVDLGLAAMSRTMPQMNIFFLAIAIKAFVGLLLLGLTIRYMGPLITRIFSSALTAIERALP